MPYVYIVRCADDSYYVGSTWNIERRLWQHNSEREGATYTRSRQPVELAWSGWYDSIAEAFAIEKRIQGWSRAKREALIRGEYGELPRLSQNASKRRRERESEGHPGARAQGPVSTTGAERPAQPPGSALLNQRAAPAQPPR